MRVQMLSSRTWARLAWIGAIAGCALLAFGMFGYAVGWNDTGGVRHGSNRVPMALIGGVTLLVLAGGAAIARARERLWTVPIRAVILVLFLISCGFVGLYVQQAGPLIRLRADIAGGAESQFVDQIIRYRAGQSQYTPIEDANSNCYAPGAPILTYWIASLAGQSTSIAAYRTVQQIFLAITVVFCSWSALALLRFLRPNDPDAAWWVLFWAPFLYLIATNPQSNIYAHVLCSDGLSVTAASIGAWLLIKHVTTQDDRWMVPMAVLPALGFLAKQKEVVWLGLYLIYFLLSGRVRLARVAVFAAASGLLVAATVLLCRALWGPAFLFWNFEMLGRLHVELKEVLSQIRDGALYLIPGLVGGALVLRGERAAVLLPVWLCWPIQMIAAIYTSGVAFTPAHLGSTTMFGMVWLLVGLATLWPDRSAESPVDRARGWLLAAATTMLVLLYSLSAGLLRQGDALPTDIDRYLADIEHEFEGMPVDQVLLDSGSWMYLQSNTVMKDRESPLGLLWGSGASNQATLDRFRGQFYRRILARKDAWVYHEPGLHKALLDGYQEVRTIPGAKLSKNGWLYPPLLSDVVVLEPRAR